MLLLRKQEQVYNLPLNFRMTQKQTTVKQHFFFYSQNPFKTDHPFSEVSLFSFVLRLKVVNTKHAFELLSFFIEFSESCSCFLSGSTYFFLPDEESSIERLCAYHNFNVLFGSFCLYIRIVQVCSNFVYSIHSGKQRTTDNMTEKII